MSRNFVDGVRPYLPDNRRSAYAERRLVVPQRPVSQSVVVTPPAPVVTPKPTTVKASGKIDGFVTPLRQTPLVAAEPAVQPLPKIAMPVVEKTHHTHKSRLSHKRPKVEKKERRHPRAWSIAMVTAAVLVLMGTGYLGWQTWQTNHDAQIAYGAQPGTNGSAVKAPNEAVKPGTDETPVTQSEKNAYTVAPDKPRMLMIPKIGVDARIIQAGLTSNGAVTSPTGIWDTIWYDGSSEPGQPGNAFINGHISGPTMPAVFVKLKDLKGGDEIDIQRGDGSIVKYSVASVQTVKLADINMAQVLSGTTGAAQSLTLMTCGGTYLGNYTYDSRVIVQAIRIN